MSGVAAEKTDIKRAVEAANDGGPIFDGKRALRLARERLGLDSKDRREITYPVDALGPLAPACHAIARGAQVQLGMAGQCLLGAASLVTQGLYNIETLVGQSPLSLMLLTLGDSGDGKSTAQDIALQPINDRQRAEHRVYVASQKEWSKQEAERKKGEASSEPPIRPYRLISDATVEGLRTELMQGPCSQGVFTAEGGAIFGGSGMSRDNRLKTVATYSQLWDRGHLSVSRSMTGRSERYGVRVAAHWLLQPIVAESVISDPLMQQQGFLPRFLVSFPISQPPRLARKFSAADDPAIGAMWERVNALLAEPLPDDAGDCPVLRLESGALELLRNTFEALERDGKKGRLRDIKPFAARAAEQVCRVAGVLTAFADEGSVSDQTMRNAIELVQHSLESWLSLIAEEAALQPSAMAYKLYAWLVRQEGQRSDTSRILSRGPQLLRSKDRRDAALKELEQHGLIDCGDGMVVAVMPRVV
jgi:hypothetical protein